VAACLVCTAIRVASVRNTVQPTTFACCAPSAIAPSCSRPTPPRPAHRAARRAQAAMRALQPGQAGALTAFAAELTDLRKYAVLNYVACIKAVKKRNRHLRAAVGPGAAGPPLRAVDLLSQQYFFTSPKLAALATRAEVLLQARAAPGPARRPPPGLERAGREGQQPAPLHVLDTSCQGGRGAWPELVVAFRLGGMPVVGGLWSCVCKKPVGGPACGCASAAPGLPR